MRTTKNTKPANTTRSGKAPKRTRPIQEDTQGIEVRDLLRRPAAFFGLSPHASDRAARLTRGPLAYQPI
jgi:hypothetical protein